MNLVIQGPGALAPAARELAGLAGARELERLGDTAWRLRGARQGFDAAGWCDARRIDAAWVPAGRRFADLRLLAMDMDSTLITIECIDEIGALVGLKPQIAAITEAAMRGEIEYPESLRRRVRLLAGLEEARLAQVYAERLRFSPGAESLVARCRAAGVRLLLVSGGFTYFTDRVRDRLGLDDAFSNVLEVADGRLTGGLVGELVDADAKARRFREAAAALGAGREHTAAIGDGANDLKMLAEAGVSVAFRAKPVVRAQASCAFMHCGLDGLLNLYE